MSDTLTIDPKLWVGNDLDARLRRHFIDVRTVDGFKDFIEARRERDETVNLASWRRIFNRSGTPVLAALVTWKSKQKLWRFPLRTRFTDPEDGQSYYVFEAVLPRIGLDLGIAMQDRAYEALPGIDPIDD